MPALRRRRITEHQEVDTEGSWAISYGDMITLLLTFFILFFSTDPEKDRAKAMDASVMAIFNPDQSRKPNSEIKDSKDSMVKEVDVAKKFDAKIYQVGQKMIVEFPNTSFFDLGKIELTKSGQVELKKFLEKYMPFAGNYILGIRAYTDNKKVLKKEGLRFSDNLELSALRSVATMRVLQQQGLPLSRMRLGGFGELRLTAEELTAAILQTPNYNQNGLALARKIVLVIEPDAKEKI